MSIESKTKENREMFYTFLDGCIWWAGNCLPKKLAVWQLHNLGALLKHRKKLFSPILLTNTVIMGHAFELVILAITKKGDEFQEAISEFTSAEVLSAIVSSDSIIGKLKESIVDLLATGKGFGEMLSSFIGYENGDSTRTMLSQMVASVLKKPKNISKLKIEAIDPFTAQALNSDANDFLPNAISTIKALTSGDILTFGRLQESNTILNDVACTILTTSLMHEMLMIACMAVSSDANVISQAARAIMQREKSLADEGEPPEYGDKPSSDDIVKEHFVKMMGIYTYSFTHSLILTTLSEYLDVKMLSHVPNNLEKGGIEVDYEEIVPAIKWLPLISTFIDMNIEHASNNDWFHPDISEEVGADISKNKNELKAAAKEVISITEDNVAFFREIMEDSPTVAVVVKLPHSTPVKKRAFKR